MEKLREWKSKCDASERSAREKHGNMLVRKALNWSLSVGEKEAAKFGYSPFALAQISKKNPIEWVITQFKNATKPSP